MSLLFTTVFNMSITASYIAVGVLLIRLLLKKLPKIFSYVLWSAVLIRLVLPLSFTSSFSFLNIIKTKLQGGTHILEYMPYDIGLMQRPSVETGVNSLNNFVNNLLPAATPTASANPLQIYISIVGAVWVLGISALLGYSVISYLKVMRNVMTATLVRDNIYETDRIVTPFVFGLIKPKIYLPLHLTKHELPYILAHEQTHIKRLDYLVKPFSFLILIVHWFNPIIWLSFVLMSKDMEMSCDENVIVKMGDGSKGSYSNSLLSLSVARSSLIKGSPLAFGESHIKSRIKHILFYKKPALWVMGLMIIATALMIIAFTANPKIQYAATTQSAYSGYEIDTLIANKTPYVGNSSRVVALIDAMPLPKGIVRKTVELQTTNSPYGITINLTMNDASDAITVQGALKGDVFYRNSILLFSLIDNVDIIKSKITNDNKEGATYDIILTREWAEKLVGSDLRKAMNSAEQLKSFIDRIDSELGAVNTTVQATGVLSEMN